MIHRVASIVCVLAAAVSFVLLAQPTRSASADSDAAIPARSFEFTYQVHFPATENPTGPVRLWLPFPQSDAYQEVRSLHIDSPAAYSQGHDSEYKNRFAMFLDCAAHIDHHVGQIIYLSKELTR